jgi:hypothetical protein
MTMVRDAAYAKDDLNAPIKLLRERATGFGSTNFALEHDASICAFKVLMQQLVNGMGGTVPVQDFREPIVE